MHVFSFGIIAYSLYIILSGKSNRDRYVKFLIFGLAVSLYLQIGLFLEFGDFDISYSFFLEILIGIWSMLLIANRFRISRSNFYRVIFFGVIIGINLLLLIVHPYSKPIIAYNVSTDLYVSGKAAKQLVSFGGRNILAAIKFIFFMFIFLIVRKLEVKEKERIVCSLTAIGKFYIGYCTLEFLIKNVFKSDLLYRIQNVIFGVAASTQTELRSRGGIYTLQGLTKEPSHLALQLVVIILLFCIHERITGKSNKTWIMLALFYMIVGMSLTSFICVFTVFCFLYLLKQNNAGKVYFMMGIFIVFIIASIVLITFYEELVSSSYYVRRIASLLSDLPSIISGNWTHSNYTYISNRARMVSIVDGLTAFKDNILFGTGIGTACCQSDFVANLEELGIVGMAAWMLAAPFGNRVKNEKYKWAIMVSFIPFIFVYSESVFWTLVGICYFLIMDLLFGDYAFSVGNLQHKKRVKN